MDGHQFDRITKHLAAGSSRRHVLRWLVGGASGVWWVFPCGPASRPTLNVQAR